MTILECDEYNNNSYFLKDIIRNMNINMAKCKWIVADLDLIPLFNGDYSGIGGASFFNIAHDFCTKIEKEKIAVLNNKELFEILEFTQTVRNGVFICLEEKYSIDINTYCPSVESRKPEEMYDNRAKCEIKILDGELFFILEGNKKI